MKILVSFLFLTLCCVSTNGQIWENLVSQSEALISQGNLDQALKLAKKARQEAVNQHGARHPSNILTMGHLARIYILMDNIKEAIPLYENKLALMKSLRLTFLAYDMAAMNLANLYIDIGNFESAAVLYEELVEIKESTKKENPLDYAVCLNNLASVRLGLDDHLGAIPLYEKAKHITKQTEGVFHPNYITTSLSVASVYAVNHEYVKALKTYKEVSNIVQQLFPDKPELHSICLTHIAGVHTMMGEVKEAIPLYKTALGIRRDRETSNDPGYASILNNLSVAYIRVGKYAEGIPLLKEAILILNGKNEHRRSYAFALGNLGVLYQKLGKYSEALTLLKRSIQVNQDINELHVLEAITMNNLGQCYLDLGDITNAISMFEAAINYRKKISVDVPDLDYLLVKNNLAETLLELGNIESSLQIHQTEIFLDANLDLLKESRSNEFTILLSNYARSLMAAGDYNKSELILEEAVKLNKSSGNEHPDHAFPLDHLAFVNMYRGNYQKAKELYEIASKIRHKTLPENHPAFAISLSNLAFYYSTVDSISKAIPLYEEAKSNLLLGSKENTLNFASLLLNLARSYFLVRDFEKSSDHLDQALSNLKQQFGVLDILSENEKSLFLGMLWSFINDINHLCTELLNVNKSMSINLFNSQLYAKGVLLSASKVINETIINGNDPEVLELYQQYVSLRNYIARSYSILEMRSTNGQNDWDSLNTVSINYERELARKVKFFKDHIINRDYEWDDVRDILRSEEAAIAIIRLSNTDSIQYVALVVTRETVDYPTAIVLSRGAKFEAELFKLYHEQTSNKNAIAPKEMLRLYSSFWEEIEIEIEDKKTVYLVPDGVYHTINLNTIKYPDNQYLYKKKDFVLLSSFRELLEHEEKNKESKRAFLIGNPNFSLKRISQDSVVSDNTNPIQRELSVVNFNIDTLRALPGSELEVDSINALLLRSGWTTQHFIGDHATEEVIKSVNRPSVFHIATHGFFAFRTDLTSLSYTGDYLLGKNPKKANQNPLFRSGLMLAGSQHTLNGNQESLNQMEDGILTGYETLNVNLVGTKLVVLSACETGLGEIQDGEGVFGLQRAFKIAGAQNIIMSLWKIDDNATQILMRKFYEYWLDGNAKRKAFKMAQHYLRTETKYDEPFYWGAFVFIGIEHQHKKGWAIELYKNNDFFSWLIVPIILAIFIIVLFWKKIRFWP